MTTSDDSTLDAVAASLGAGSESVSLVAVGTLATITAMLVGLGTFAAMEAGYAALATSFLTAVVLFVGALSLFEAGRKIGRDLDV